MNKAVAKVNYRAQTGKQEVSDDVTHAFLWRASRSCYHKFVTYHKRFQNRCHDIITNQYATLSNNDVSPPLNISEKDDEAKRKLQCLKQSTAIRTLLRHADSVKRFTALSILLQHTDSDLNIAINKKQECIFSVGFNTTL